MSRFDDESSVVELSALDFEVSGTSGDTEPPALDVSGLAVSTKSATLGDTVTFTVPVSDPSGVRVAYVDFRNEATGQEQAVTIRNGSGSLAVTDGLSSGSWAAQYVHVGDEYGNDWIYFAPGVSRFDDESSVVDLSALDFEVVDSTPVTQYTVTYSDGCDGAAFATQSYTVDEGATTPAFSGTPTREGYTFAGWSPEVTSTVTADATYVAQWTPATYTVTYSDGCDGAAFSPQTFGATSGVATPAFSGTPTRGGYEFLGWSPEPAATVTADVTYVAQWKATVHAYTITYSDGCDGTAFSAQIFSVNEGDATPAFTGTPTREGYTFAGWSPEVASIVTKDATYVAQWIVAPKATYTVTYSDGCDGAAFASQSYTATEGDATPSFSGTPSRAGYEFAGWSPEVVSIVTADATYVAQWKTKKYSITYTDGCNGEAFTQRIYTAQTGAKTPAFNTTPTRDGYSFVGWSPEVAETVTGDAIYVAQWEPIVTLTINEDDDPVEISYESSTESSISWASSDANVARIGSQRSSSSVATGPWGTVGKYGYYCEIVPVAEGYAWVTGTVGGKVVKQEYVHVTPSTKVTLTDSMISLASDSVDYSPAGTTDAVTVTVNGETLSEGTDYVVSYAANDRVGFATVTVTGIGNYTGSVTKTFAIAWRVLGDADVAAVADQAYTGAAIEPEAVVTVDGVQLTQDTDYTVAFSVNTAVGTATATIRGTGNYKGTVTKTFEIVPRTLQDTDIQAIPDQTYTGKALEPAVLVSVDGAQLVAGTDYELAYSDNVETGAATVTVTGKGNYTGVVAASFNIVLPATANWDRLWGQNAYETMERVVEADGAFPTGHGGTVYLATGDGYWDALAGSGLAGLDGAPVLITPTDYLRDETARQLQRLAPGKVVVLGGPAAVSDAVLDQVRSLCGCEVERVAGDTARDTARMAYESRDGWGDTCVIATWTGYWDALSIAPYAWAKHAPIFLTDGRNMLDDATLADVRGFSRVVIVGGAVVVSPEVEGQLAGSGATVVRLAGENAVKTSAEIARWEVEQGMGTSHMCVATGDGYWDALSAAPLAGASDSVLVICNPGQMQAVDAVYSGSSDGRVIGGHVIGGPVAVTDDEWNYLTQ